VYPLLADRSGVGKWRPIGVGLGEVQPCERRLVTAGRYGETVGSPSSQKRHGKASPSPPGPATPVRGPRRMRPASGASCGTGNGLGCGEGGQGYGTGAREVRIRHVINLCGRGQFPQPEVERWVHGT